MGGGGGNEGDSHEGHDHHADDAERVGVAVLTVSSSRSIDSDESGEAIVELLEAEGHTVVARDLVTDELGAIRNTVEGMIDREGVEAVVTTGGTGVSPDDVTVPAVEALFDRELAGIGERFRALSVEDVGAVGMLSRATAGVADGVPVFCLPGSRAAVELGMAEVVLPILGHVVGLAGDAEGDREASGSATLTHVDSEGDAEMVDVGDKAETRRRAVARGTLELDPETIAAVRADEVGKGDVLTTVRVGAIDAVKHTWETIPLCHQIPITNVETTIDLREDALDLEVAVETTARTGPEMEALQGVTTGLGVAWDMVKSAEKDEAGQYPGTRISDVRVVEKHVER